MILPVDFTCIIQEADKRCYPFAVFCGKISSAKTLP
ncbi:hypothetical protein FAEPRAM212_00759 [Faecalibacterium prausnitzii M21/2]|uniref:Uncharacterized protein n=1 Tax=Faecalibacterium prausnitzii M21/2 TaxID=411485 RepID=A8S8H1_9FIRM|nr:hypothetical protein FAEPRAM212_00759 [Faecalibacterium prausnitzii M21/2]